MVAVMLALGASVSWGAADFLAGTASRRYPALGVLAVANAVSLAAAVAVLLVAGEPVPPAPTLALAAGTGLVTTVGLLALYRGLAAGPMGVVAPLSGCGVAVPVLVGVATGDRVPPAAAAGMLLAVAGVTLAVAGSGEPAGRARPARAARLGVAAALLAAAAFGTDRVLTEEVAQTSVRWLLAVSHLSAGLVLAALFARRVRRRPSRATVPAVVAAGLLQVTATALFAYSTRDGTLSVVAVCAALYPVVTVLLARVAFRERLRPLQSVGVLATLGGLALIGGSTA